MHVPTSYITLHTHGSNGVLLFFVVVGTNVTFVVLVTYQRSGSSFLGELFNQNPDAFVWFEPLDGVYSALYGTGYGYNVPADLWNHHDGSERYIYFMVIAYYRLLIGLIIAYNKVFEADCTHLFA